MGNARLGPKTLGRALDAYVTKLEVRAKQKSLRNAQSSSKILRSILGNPSIHDLTEADIDRFIVARRKQGVRDKSINGDLIILRATLRHAKKIGMVDHIPKVQLLKVPKRKAIKVLSKADLRLLLETAGKGNDPRVYGILLIAMHSAFRSDEILHLAWADTDPEELSLRITSKPRVNWSSKSHQERTVFVAPAVFDWLARWRADTQWPGEDDWIFATKSGRPMSTTNVARGMRRVFEDAGLYRDQNACLHALRHAAATRMLGAGTDLETVKDILGHADASTTSLYLHSTDKRKRDAAKKLALD